MAARKKQNADFFETLRSSGLRKRVARNVADAAKKADGRIPAPARKAIDDLRSLAGEIENRLGGSAAERRKAGAMKAARTRKAKAAKRSQAAKKAARTRAKA
jgi:hypothetical protein